MGDFNEMLGDPDWWESKVLVGAIWFACACIVTVGVLLIS